MRDSRHSVGEHWIVLGSCLLPGLGSFIDTILVLVLTVGSWLTPITQGLNPAQVDAGVESTVQIAGDNFQENMTVRLGGVRLIRVRLLDEHRLEVELPATLLPGLYDLVVTSADGTSSFRPEILAVGDQLYPPLIAHNNA